MRMGSDRLHFEFGLVALLRQAVQPLEGLVDLAIAEPGLVEVFLHGLAIGLFVGLIVKIVLEQVHQDVEYVLFHY